MARRLAQSCCNDDGSGCSGTRRENQNFEAVRRALQSEGVFVWAYEAMSASAFTAGKGVKGRWLLGDPDGECVGLLVWLRQERHVMRVLQRDDVFNAERCWCGSRKGAPWLRYVVAAPKKTKRGANNKKGEKVGSLVPKIALKISDGDGAREQVAQHRAGEYMPPPSSLKGTPGIAVATGSISRLHGTGHGQLSPCRSDAPDPIAVEVLPS